MPTSKQRRTALHNFSKIIYINIYITKFIERTLSLFIGSLHKHLSWKKKKTNNAKKRAEVEKQPSAALEAHKSTKITKLFYRTQSRYAFNGYLGLKQLFTSTSPPNSAHTAQNLRQLPLPVFDHFLTTVEEFSSTLCQESNYRAKEFINQPVTEVYRPLCLPCRWRPT